MSNSMISGYFQKQHSRSAQKSMVRSTVSVVKRRNERSQLLSEMKKSTENLNELRGKVA